MTVTAIFLDPVQNEVLIRVELVGASPAHMRTDRQSAARDRPDRMRGKRAEREGDDPPCATLFGLGGDGARRWGASCNVRGDACLADRDRGSPWFLGSDQTYRHGRELLELGPRVIARTCMPVSGGWKIA